MAEVGIHEVDLKASQHNIVKPLARIYLVVSASSFGSLPDETSLANAANVAGVKRVFWSSLSL
ncbi:hypothetical protein GCG54_00004967 [Colletotrichum gloeosporioides]|uniref:NmrA-like domain-containing protein n=1 Tax=Colletotrichum gloeosporioides TaxID=474922 RepID=A0A8H4CHL0_COLGL|nr:uncharacterized protein GCG54_00004967 [Colletotrichum gloeosporioides]KAF3803787.1 hypothetical protein GCG54_00004967 [Colletotrichum gloeosporioides]